MNAQLPPTATNLEVRAGEATVAGSYDPAFEPVVSAFLRNFEHGGELGGSVVVYHRGVAVVDVWGGVRNRRTDEPWEADTRSLVFSVSKGMLSVCLGILLDRGALNLDERVASYWPEFAAAGKSEITVRQLMSHTAGLPYLDAPLTRRDVLAWTPIVDALAAQKPLWAPGSAVFYHGLTIGWLGGELLRRIAGLGPRAFFEREVAGPLGLHASFGVPAEQTPTLARQEPPLPEQEAEGAARLAAQREDVHASRMLSLTGALPFPGWSDGENDTYNSEDVLAAELPGVNFVTSARDLARVYAALVSPMLDGSALVSAATLGEMSRWLSGGGLQPDFSPANPPNRWGVGFMVDAPPGRPLLGPGSFGHDGAGGQLGFAHPEHQLGFAYCNNQMGGIYDERANNLCRALGSALGTEP